jgi:hypothetical protein
MAIWKLQLNAKNVTATDDIIQERAKNWTAHWCCNFTYCKGWLHCFKQCHGLLQHIKQEEMQKSVKKFKKLLRRRLKYVEKTINILNNTVMMRT